MKSPTDAGLEVKECRLGKVEFLVHRELTVLMRRAVAGLRAPTELPRAIIEAQVGTALTIGAADEPAHVKCATAARHDQILLAREQDRLNVDLGAGDAVLVVMNRAEGEGDGMETVQQEPARQVDRKS